MKKMMLVALLLAGCGQSVTGPESLEEPAPVSVAATPQPAPVRAFDAELRGRRGDVLVWTSLDIPGTVTVVWWVTTPESGYWGWIDRVTVPVGPNGSVLVSMPSTSVSCAGRYAVELLGQGWRETALAACP